MTYKRLFSRMFKVMDRGSRFERMTWHLMGDFRYPPPGLLISPGGSHPLLEPPVTPSPSWSIVDSIEANVMTLITPSFFHAHIQNRSIKKLVCITKRVLSRPLYTNLNPGRSSTISPDRLLPEFFVGIISCASFVSSSVDSLPSFAGDRPLGC